MVSKICLPTPLKIRVEPVGKWFEKYCLLVRGTEDESEEESEEEEEKDIELEDWPELPNLDPKEWKDQDHYAVLGLRKIRFRASAKQVKSAHKAAVLKHHPDKRRAAGAMVPADSDSDYFSCITHAYEILGDRVKRRAFDSVDPLFDDDIPSNNKQNKQNFINVFGPVFEMNSRWSNKKPVPLLGNMDSTFEDVDGFYSFWYNFDSWREYSYLDEEDKEKAEDAYERRWMEKQNRSERQKRKKEEMQRIRQLVDNAYACDPRIKLFRENEKKRKEEEKANKLAAARKLAEEKQAEENKKKEQERLEKEKLEQERVKQQQAAKKAKEKEKKAMKKEKQKLDNFCKERNYFQESEAEKLKMIDQLSHLMISISLVEIIELNKDVTSSKDNKEAGDKIKSKLNDFQKKLDAEKQQHLEAASKKKSGEQKTNSKDDWVYEDVQLLIKAVNLFPAGTEGRWEVVAKYINTHSQTGKQRVGKECLGRAKNLRDTELKAKANQKVFERFQENQKTSSGKKVDEVEISQRYDAPKPWNSDEQRLLEQALKTYPSSTPQRWDKIAETVGSRTKKECMLRYKDLVEMVKAKKSVQADKTKK
uniref:dnaJ homolog subfamily C member 2-like n=1 Tax=Styela clava TaxID=7725 RepID=UPI0019397FF0|nr:dnaJ homolog subfamily C member 2-like [Styela clava]